MSIFSFPYINQNDPLDQNYGSAIFIPNPGNYYRGSKVKLNGYAWIDASHFIDNSFQLVFNWHSSDGTLLGEDENLELLIDNSFNSNLVLKVTFLGDLGTSLTSESYIIIDFSNEKTSILFNTPYEYYTGNKEVSNLDLHYKTSKFPKWSTANKNIFSNAAKVSDAFFSTHSALHGMIDLISTVNKIGAEDQCFGIADTEYIYNRIYPFIIENNDGYISSGGAYLYNYFTKLPITKILIENTRKVFKINSQSTASSPIHLPNPSTIFISCVDADISNPVPVTVTGTDLKGDYSQEAIVLISSTKYQTFNIFSSILRIDAPRKVYMSNVLELDNDHFYYSSISNPLSISSKDGEYMVPEFSSDGRYIIVHNALSQMKTEEFIFDTEIEFSKIFITNQMDIIGLHGTDLYSGKLRFSIDSRKLPNSSANNNDYIWLDIHSPKIGENIRLIIDTEKIRSDFGSKQILVSIDNSSEELFLNRDGSLQSEKQWIDIANVKKIITLELSTTDNTDLTFSLSVPERVDKFYANRYTNIINMILVLSNVDDIFMHNRELFMEINGELYKGKGKRESFLEHEGGIVMEGVYDIGEIHGL